MAETMQFHLGDVLSITTGRLVAPSKMDGVYRILNFMTGDSLFTHALVRAAHVCAPALLEQHKDLAAIQAPDFGSPDEVGPWLEAMIRQYGEMREVRPLASYEHKDPFTELAEMMTPKAETTR